MGQQSPRADSDHAARTARRVIDVSLRWGKANCEVDTGSHFSGIAHQLVTQNCAFCRVDVTFDGVADPRDRSPRPRRDHRIAASRRNRDSRQVLFKEKWEASVARCLPYRWNPLLLPGGVQPRFCPSNL